MQEQPKRICVRSFSKEDLFREGPHKRFNGVPFTPVYCPDFGYQFVDTREPLFHAEFSQFRRDSEAMAVALTEGERQNDTS